MTELVLTKTPGGALAPADQQTAERLGRMKTGEAVRGDFKKARNPQFHRKGFALFNFAFDLWDAPALEYKGQPVAKEFNRFRKDLTILAGHYESVVTLKGEVRLEAKSLSFASMDEAEFESVYRSLLTVIWDRILKAKGYESPDKVAAIIDQLLAFDS